MTPQAIVAKHCRTYGPKLALPPGSPLDGARVLWALAGCESDFGAFATTRHEPAYCYHGRYENGGFSLRWGCAAHCSYGPWQMMWCHLVGRLPAQLSDPGRYTFTAGECSGDFALNACLLCQAAVNFLNTEILGRQQAATLAEIAKAWNHGNWRDQFDDSAYTDRAAKFYAAPFPDEETAVPAKENA